MLSVIVPAYNEANNGLCQTVDTICTVLEQHGLEYEIIIVDDGSTDGTYRIVSSATQLHSNISVVGYPNNKGKGYALRYGFRFTKGDLVLFQDGDSDLSPIQIPRFLDQMRSENADVVVGCKLHPKSNVVFPKSRMFLSKSYGLMIKTLFNLGIKETQVGQKLFKRDVLEKTIPIMRGERYAFDVELLANAQRRGYKLAEAPIDINYRLSSRISPKDICTIFADTLSIFWHMRILRSYDKEVR